MQDPRERPEAQALASTFAKLAAVLKEADADPRAPVAAGAGAAGPPVKGGAAQESTQGPPLPEDDLEDALLAGSLNVDLLQEPPSAGDSAATGTVVMFCTRCMYTSVLLCVRQRCWCGCAALCPCTISAVLPTRLCLCTCSRLATWHCQHAHEAAP